MAAFSTRQVAKVFLLPVTRGSVKQKGDANGDKNKTVAASWLIL